jgi:flagellar protein FliS
VKIDVNNPYFRTKVLTASPEELRLLLIEGCIRFIRQGRQGLVDKDYEAVYEGLSQAKAIVMELINSMKPELAPDLCRSLSGLYTFIYRMLIEASFEKDVAKADEALRLMEYERETWMLVMEKLAREREAGAGPAPADGAPDARPEGPAEYRPLSIQG